MLLFDIIPKKSTAKTTKQAITPSPNAYSETYLNLQPPIQEWAEEEGIAEDDIRERLTEKADEVAKERADRIGPEVMTYVEKTIVLQTLDHLWREHLVNLDHLRSVIGFRGMAQRDPLQEYKNEAFELFQSMLVNLRRTVTAQMMRVELVREAADDPDPLTDMTTIEDDFGENFVGEKPDPFREVSAQLLLFDGPPVNPEELISAIENFMDILGYKPHEEDDKAIDRLLELSASSVTLGKNHD